MYQMCITSKRNFGGTIIQLPDNPISGFGSIDIFVSKAEIHSSRSFISEDKRD